MKSMFSASKSLSALAAGVALATSIGMAAPADAFSVSIDPSFGSTENTGSSAFLDFDFAQDGLNTVLSLGVTNTSSVQSTLVGVGFDLPSAINYIYNSNGSSFTSLYTNASLQPYGSFDVGIRSAGPGNFAGGNPQQGLTNGQSATVLFTFNGQNAGNLESAFQSLFSQPGHVVGRFQQVGLNREGSDKVLGGVVETPSEAVPEPTTMLGVAVAGGAIAARKKLQRKANA